MRILKFANGDAPSADLPLSFDASSNTLTAQGSTATWKASSSSAAKSLSSFALLAEDGTVLPVSEVVLLERDHSSSVPQQVTDAHVAHLDFRNKAGQRLDASKSEYGRTYAKAQAKPMMMNADAVREKRNEYNKRERENLAEAIERGEKIEPKTRDKKSRQDPAEKASEDASPSKETKKSKSKSNRKSTGGSA